MAVTAPEVLVPVAFSHEVSVSEEVWVLETAEDFGAEDDPVVVTVTVVLVKVKVLVVTDGLELMMIVVAVSRVDEAAEEVEAVEE